MKKLILSLFLLTILSPTCFSQKINQLEGVWKLEEKIVPKGKKHVNLLDQQPEFKSYKFVTGNKFIVCAAGKSGQLYYSHCGKCAIDGDTWYETIELSNNKNLIGVTNQMKSKLENGKWIIETGTIQETWIRVDENKITQEK